MDVKISYGIDVENVPEVVSTWLDECADMLTKAIRRCQAGRELVCLSADQDGSNYLSITVDMIEKAREDLSAIDRYLTDSAMILTGLIGYIEPSEEQPPETDDAD